MSDWEELKRGIEAAYHMYGHYARVLEKLRAAFEPLENEIRAISETSTLPDGDGVNVPTQLWAEDWVRERDQLERSA